MWKIEMPKKNTEEELSTEEKIIKAEQTLWWIFEKKNSLIRIDVYSVLRIQLFSATSDGTKYNYAFWKKNGKSFKGQFKVTLSAISAISHQNYSGNIPTHLFFTLDTLKFSRVFFY